MGTDTEKLKKATLLPRLGIVELIPLCKRYVPVQWATLETQQKSTELEPTVLRLPQVRGARGGTPGEGQAGWGLQTPPLQVPALLQSNLPPCGGHTLRGTLL